MRQYLPVTLGRAAGRAASAAIDLLFHKRCVDCDKECAFLCQECQEGLPHLESPFCFLCSQPGRLMMRLCPRPEVPERPGTGPNAGTASGGVHRGQ